MGTLRPLPDSYETSRATLHRVATHVLARRRHAVTGRFGLRAAPGGFATPAFGDGPEVVAYAAGAVIREAAARTTTRPIDGSSLAELAALAGVDLATEFRAGEDTPPLGDPDVAISLDGDGAAALAAWYAFGWAVLDASLTALGAGAEPSVIQLWPEHFDAGVDVAAGPRRVNLGASPGDGFEPAPYLYVGPHDDARPGDPAFWNAPFGAVLRYADLLAAADPIATGSAFVLEGVARMVRG